MEELWVSLANPTLEPITLRKGMVLCLAEKIEENLVCMMFYGELEEQPQEELTGEVESIDE